MTAVANAALMDAMVRRPYIRFPLGISAEEGPCGPVLLRVQIHGNSGDPTAAFVHHLIPATNIVSAVQTLGGKLQRGCFGLHARGDVVVERFGLQVDVSALHAAKTEEI
jgi:hypothetical protein